MKCEGICGKPIKTPGAGWNHWLGVWKSYSNLGHWAGSLGKLSKEIQKYVDIQSSMASLVSNSVGKTCKPGEITRNISQVWCGYGGVSAKIIIFESNLRIVGTYQVNSGEIIRNILDSEASLVEYAETSQVFWASVSKNLENLQKSDARPRTYPEMRGGPEGGITRKSRGKRRGM